MSTLSRRVLGVVAGLLLHGTVVAAGPLPGFILSAETEHFSFYSRHNEKPDPKRSERYLSEVQELLGVRVSGRVDYYLHERPEDIAASTGTYAAGLTLAGSRQIHSTHGFHAHEIVHMVASELGDPGPFFNEGLAVALAENGERGGRKLSAPFKAQARALQVSALVDSFQLMDSELAYSLAGSFVASLIKTHGVGKVAEFFRACGCDGRTRQAAFRQTFGQTLEAAWGEWGSRL